MAKRSGPGRKKIHRLHVMGNVDDGGRVMAAVPLFTPGQPYPLGLSLQRLHGIGETGVVVRMVGADGNMASMVVQPGKDPATVTTGFTNPGGSVMVDLSALPPDQVSAALNRAADRLVDDGELPPDPIDPTLGPELGLGHSGRFVPARAGDRSGPQPSDDASKEEIDEYDALVLSGLTPDQAAARMRAKGAGGDEDRD